MTLADMHVFSEFEVELWELVERHFPGATRGEMPSHVDACVIMQIALGRLLAWRMLRGEEVFKKDMQFVTKMIEDTARECNDIAREIRGNAQSTTLQ